LSLLKYINFSYLLSKIFELKPIASLSITKSSSSKTITDLNHNEKRVLLAIIQHPTFSLTELSRKIWLSKPTISKIKKDMINNNLVVPIIIPNLKKMSLGLAVMLSLKFEQKFMKKVYTLESQFEKSDFHSVCNIIGDKEITSLMFFKNKEEYENELRKIISFYEKNEIPLNHESFVFSINKQMHFEKTDFSSITKKLLFPEEF